MAQYATLRVMSFNVRGSFVADGLNVWSNRRELNVQTILRARPDVIGFQEIQSGNWEDYNRLLAGYQGELGPDATSRREHPSIFWNPARLDRLEQGGFWLSPTPDRYSLADEWGAICERAALWIRFGDKTTGRTLLVLNTHLDHGPELARINGAAVILDRIAAVARDGEPVVLTGDFNCDPGGQVHRRLLAAGFLDSHLAAGGVDGPDAFTFHGFTGQRLGAGPGRAQVLESHAGHAPAATDPASKAEERIGRIDWILLGPNGSAVTVADARIIRDAAPPIYPSDHWPIVADLAMSL